MEAEWGSQRNLLSNIYKKYMKQLSGEQMFSSALRCHGALLCTSQLWTIDPCAWVWQQVLVRGCLTRLGLLRRTYLSAAAPPNANTPHRSPGFLQRAASRVCKWMFYIIMLFHSGREEDETIKLSIYFLKIKLTLCAPLCTVRCGIRWAWRGERTHICQHVTHTHTRRAHSHPSFLLRPLSVLRMRGPRGAAARCGCKWTAVPRRYSCPSYCKWHPRCCLGDRKTLRNIRFTRGKPCHVELGVFGSPASWCRSSIPRGSRFLIGECWN